MLVDQKQLPSGTSDASGRESNTRMSYRAELARIILKSRLVASEPGLDKMELAAMVEAWNEVLEPLVPIGRLNDAYIRAAQSHKKLFGAVSAQDICAAYNSLRESEFNRPSRVPEDRRLETSFWCEVCHNTGTEIIQRGAETYARPCTHGA